MQGLCFHIGLNARRSNVTRWGEHAFAISLGKALSGQGCHVRIFCRDEQPQLEGAGDVILWICGPHVSEPIAGCVNFLWMISPPNRVSLGLLRRLQGVFIASKELTDAYRASGVNAYYMPQATDPDFFHPGRDDGTARYGITFVGNLTQRAPRHNIRQAIEMGFDVTVWGAGWKGAVAPQHYGGPRLDADELARVYAQSDVVLNCHMQPMVDFGMMSNRSYDALASGARVVSDVLRGFEAADLPDLWLASGKEALGAALRRAIEVGPISPAGRASIAAHIRQHYSFDKRAEIFIAQAGRALAAQVVCRGAVIVPAAGGAAKTGQVQEMPVRDLASESAEALAQMLDKQMANGPLRLCLSLTNPASAGQGTPCQAMGQTAQAVLRLGVIHARRGQLAALEITPPPDEGPARPVHAGMFDLRRAQALVTDGERADEMAALCTRARRVVEGLSDAAHPLRLEGRALDDSRLLVRIANDRPLYAHSPANYDRDTQKKHVGLWPRKQTVSFERPVGVLLHLYYPELAGLFCDRLTRLEMPYRLYISTDTDAKANAIAAVFPNADIRVLPNRGRDVFPKLYGFSDVFSRHDVTLHLHGKKSGHSAKLDRWLELILECLLPEPTELNRLLSFFRNIPDLGLVVPLTHPSVIGAGHWGDNLDLAQEVLARIGCDIGEEAELPGAFPMGGMFWARNDAIRPLLDLRLGSDHFPPETGQLDATVAHAIERLYGVVCRQTGHKVLRVAPSGMNRYRAFRAEYNSNRALRDALTAGTFRI